MKADISDEDLYCSHIEHPMARVQMMQASKLEEFFGSTMTLLAMQDMQNDFESKTCLTEVPVLKLWQN